MSSYSDPNQALVPSDNATNAEQKMKLYQAFIFSIPICFTFIVLFVFYVIYRRRRNGNVDWSSLGMRGGPGGNIDLTNNLSMIEIGLKKELREMLPIVIFGDSFTVKDPQCSVCLGDYQEGEKLQQIPACEHTFHMECIGTWLTSHITCPLCRVSLIPRVPQDQSHQTSDIVPSMENSNARVSAEAESQPTTEEISHIDDGQEGNGDTREISKETQENDQNIIGTSNGYCNCRLG
ncbi:RING-H2 finger protein ATL7 [Cardamine amara subsp. amara]|uniref:RING-type E3 ubiquitin transferase n=1 Tax=Cardamine amara subsp. amara TaxID=228776 RepID=A0ABD1ASJ9_CARAN